MVVAVAVVHRQWNMVLTTPALTAASHPSSVLSAAVAGFLSLASRPWTLLCEWIAVAETSAISSFDVLFHGTSSLDRRVLVVCCRPSYSNPLARPASRVATFRHGLLPILCNQQPTNQVGSRSRCILITSCGKRRNGAGRLVVVVVVAALAIIIGLTITTSHRGIISQTRVIHMKSTPILVLQ